MVHKCRIRHSAVIDDVLSKGGKLSFHCRISCKNNVSTLTFDTAQNRFWRHFCTVLRTSGENMFECPISHDGIHPVYCIAVCYQQAIKLEKSTQFLMMILCCSVDRLSLEKSVETAMLLSLAGVNCVLTNQWHASLHDNANKLDTLMKGTTKTLPIWRSIRSWK